MIYGIVDVETIRKFLEFYGINYDLLSVDSQSIIIVLSNILFLLFWFIVAYIIYRVFMWCFR